jgi:hypothetical protein
MEEQNHVKINIRNLAYRKYPIVGRLQLLL